MDDENNPDVTKTDPAAPVTPPAGDAGERPSWLPEGFNSPEEFRAAYDKMQTEQKPDEENDPQADSADTFASEFVQEAGLDSAELGRQLLENGSLDAEAMSKLEAVAEKRNIPKSVVAEFIQGKTALAQQKMQTISQEEQELISGVGGKANYDKMTEWMRSNLSPAEIEAYDEIVATGDFKKTKFTIDSMHARYKATARIPGRSVLGSSGVDMSGDVFHSREEQVKAQADPRYRNDPTFQRAVIEKIQRTRTLLSN